MHSFKALRFANNLSQNDLSEMTGIPRSKIGMIENEEIIPSKRMKKRIASAFEVEVGDIFWADEELEESEEELEDEE